MTEGVEASSPLSYFGPIHKVPTQPKTSLSGTVAVLKTLWDFEAISVRSDNASGSQIKKDVMFNASTHVHRHERMTPRDGDGEIHCIDDELALRRTSKTFVSEISRFAVLINGTGLK